MKDIRRLNLPPLVIGALIALFWNAVVVVLVSIAWPLIKNRYASQWLYYGGPFDLRITPQVILRTIVVYLRVTAIPSLAGGGILGRMLGPLKAGKRCTKGWASCLGLGVGLAGAEMLALVVSIGDVALFGGTWYLVLVDTMARILLVTAPVGIVVGYVTGRRIWRRLG